MLFCCRFGCFRNSQPTETSSEFARHKMMMKRRQKETMCRFSRFAEQSERARVDERMGARAIREVGTPANYRSRPLGMTATGKEHGWSGRSREPTCIVAIRYHTVLVIWYLVAQLVIMVTLWLDPTHLCLFLVSSGRASPYITFLHTHIAPR